MVMDISSDCIDKDLLGSTFVTSRHRNKAKTNKRLYSGILKDPIEDLGDSKMAKNARNEKDGQTKQKDSGKQNIMESTKEKTVSPRTSKYEVNAQGPFFVLIKLNKSAKVNEDLSFLAMSRKLYRLNIRFTEGTAQSRNCWKVTLNTRTEANNALDNAYLKKIGFDIFIPHTATHVRGEIRGIPLDTSMEEVIEVIIRTWIIR